MNSQRFFEIFKEKKLIISVLKVSGCYSGKITYLKTVLESRIPGKKVILSFLRFQAFSWSNNRSNFYFAE